VRLTQNGGNGCVCASSAPHPRQFRASCSTPHTSRPKRQCQNEKAIWLSFLWGFDFFAWLLG